MNLFSFIKDDWEKIPQNVRYFLLSGSTLLAITWLSDHWGKDSYKLFSWDFRNIFFSLGITLILVGLVMIVSKQLYTYFNLLRLKIKYPIKNHPKTFALVWFQPGRLYLFDKKSKLSYHVHPWETAEDLSFVGHGFNCLHDYETALAGDVRIGSPYNIRIKSFHYVGQ